MTRIEFGRRAQAFEDDRPQIIFTRSMLGRHPRRLTETKRIGAIELNLLVIKIGFVHDEQHILFRFTQHLRNAVVETGHTFESIDDKQNQVGRGDGEIHLLLRGLD